MKHFEKQTFSSPKTDMLLTTLFSTVKGAIITENVMVIYIQCSVRQYTTTLSMIFKIKDKCNLGDSFSSNLNKELNF